MQRHNNSDIQGASAHSDSEGHHCPNKNDNAPQKRLKRQDHSSISSGSPEGNGSSYNNLAIIAAKIREVKVNKLLIDEDSPYDVIHLNAFWKMEIGGNHLTKEKNVMSTMGWEIPLFGSINLPVTIEERPEIPSQMVEFLVFDHPSSYNGVLRRPS